MKATVADLEGDALPESEAVRLRGVAVGVADSESVGDSAREQETVRDTADVAVALPVRDAEDSDCDSERDALRDELGL